jgi:hypothetical protein
VEALAKTVSKDLVTGDLAKVNMSTGKRSCTSTIRHSSLKSPASPHSLPISGMDSASSQKLLDNVKADENEKAKLPPCKKPIPRLKLDELNNNLACTPDRLLENMAIRMEQNAEEKKEMLDELMTNMTDQAAHELMTKVLKAADHDCKGDKEKYF